MEIMYGHVVAKWKSWKFIELYWKFEDEWKIMYEFGSIVK